MAEVEESPQEKPLESPLQSQQELLEASGMDVNATTQYFARNFLDKVHYSSITSKLSDKWHRLQSLSAAVKLMERYGVTIDAAEEERLSQLEESQQIEALVMKMPQQTNDEFQQFFLQLQVLVSSASKVRQALETAKPEGVEQVLNDNEGSGISYAILRMAIVQAGSEVSSLKRRQKLWAKEVGVKMGKSIHGTEDAINIKKKLEEAERKLAIFTAGQNEKSKKVIMNFLNSSSEGLKAACFKGWVSITKQEKLEREISSEFKDKIDNINAKLLDYQTKSMEGVRKMMAAKAGELTSTLLKETLQIWATEVFDWKRNREMQQEMEELQAALNAAKDDQKARSRSVLARMSADTEAGVIQMTFSSWIAFHLEYQKDKAMEDEVKKQEQRLKEHMKGKSDSARKVLIASLGNSDSALLTSCFTEWKEVVAEAKEEERMADLLNDAEGKFKSFGAGAKLKGKNALEKSTYFAEQAILIRIWNMWRLHVRTEATLAQYSRKIDAKRRQLVGVQEMFRSFANELESGLKRGAESTRGENAPAVLAGKGLHKSDSLPAIDQKLSSGRRPQKHSHEKEAMSKSQGQIRQHRTDGGDRERKAHSSAVAYPAAGGAAGGDGAPAAPRAAWG